MTRAERLDAAVAKASPKRKAFFDVNGVWPTQDEVDSGVTDKPAMVKNEQTGLDEPIGARQRGPGYAIKTLSENRRRVELTTDDGEIVTGTGANIEDALTALEARLG